MEIVRARASPTWSGPEGSSHNEFTFGSCGLHLLPNQGLKTREMQAHTYGLVRVSPPVDRWDWGALPKVKCRKATVDFRDFCVLSCPHHQLRSTDMSIFGKILGGIFNRKAPPATAAAPAQQAASSPPIVVSSPQPPEPVDIEAVLNELAAASSQKLNWRTSIVDLMKLVGMESSLAERKALADELGYTGDKSDSAAMNIWLHKQVLAKLAANGGAVPQDLLD